jgi:hypothetical protein
MYYFTMEPCGAHPTQAEGVIEETGQAFYFRYRGGHASITISDSEHIVVSRTDPRIACFYEKRVTSPDVMPASQVDQLVSTWITQYLAQRAIQSSSRWS